MTKVEAVERLTELEDDLEEIKGILNDNSLTPSQKVEEISAIAFDDEEEDEDLESDSDDDLESEDEEE